MRGHVRWCASAPNPVRLAYLGVPVLAGQVQGRDLVAVCLIDVGLVVDEQPARDFVPDGCGQMQRRLACQRANNGHVSVSMGLRCERVKIAGSKQGPLERLVRARETPNTRERGGDGRVCARTGPCPASFLLVPAPRPSAWTLPHVLLLGPSFPCVLPSHGHSHLPSRRRTLGGVPAYSSSWITALCPAYAAYNPVDSRRSRSDFPTDFARKHGHGDAPCGAGLRPSRRRRRAPPRAAPPRAAPPPRRSRRPRARTVRSPSPRIRGGSARGAARWKARVTPERMSCTALGDRPAAARPELPHCTRSQQSLRDDGRCAMMCDEEKLADPGRNRAADGANGRAHDGAACCAVRIARERAVNALEQLLHN